MIEAILIKREDVLNKILSILMVLMFFCEIVKADEVTNIIKEATGQYEKGDYIAAINSLDYATGIIRQKRGESLQAFLPRPLKGWTADETTYQAAGAIMLGGGVSAEGKYYNGNSFVSVNIITDSPMLQGVLMMLNNPIIMSTGAKRMETIKGQRAIVDYDPRIGKGEINVAIANRVLVNIKGTSVSREDLKAYADSIDYAKLSSFAQAS